MLFFVTSTYPERQRFRRKGHRQRRALSDAHEHIGKVDEILTEWPDDLDGRKNNVRALFRTIGRLLDEAGTPSIYMDRAFGDERTNRELRAVLSALDIPADRRAFDINTEVQGLVTSDEFESNDLARERLRHLRDVLNATELD
jgi:hypothetical protein